MNNILRGLIIGLFVFIIGCTGAPIKHVFLDGNQKAYQIEEVYDIGIFTPTIQYERVSSCDVVITHINTTKHGNGYDSKSVTNCVVLNDEFKKDIASPIGPMLLQAGGVVGAGALIGDGIRDSSDNINNTNSQSQSQGQIQLQKQKQFQINKMNKHRRY